LLKLRLSSLDEGAVTMSEDAAERSEEIKGVMARADYVNIPTLRPNSSLIKLRADLEENANLRKQLTEDPSAVLQQYGLSVALPAGSLRRLSTGGGITIPGEVGVHADAHADAHADFNPHIDWPMHLDLF
jgi:hypothetical protein